MSTPLELLDLHLDDLRRRGLSVHTIAHREQSIKTFLREMPLDCERLDLERWLDNRHMKVATRTVWISHLAMYYRWLIQEGYFDKDPTVKLMRPKLGRQLPHPISDMDLLKAIDHSVPMIKVWVLLGAYGGLRVGEIAGLHREDILVDQRLIRINDAKGGFQRIIPLHPEVTLAIREAQLPMSGPLFILRDGTRVTPNYISLTLGRQFKRLGINATAHSLRHWFATRLLSTTHDLRVVGETLGHRNLNTTTIYADWDREVANAGVWSLKVAPPDKKKRMAS